MKNAVWFLIISTFALSCGSRGSAGHAGGSTSSDQRTDSLEPRYGTTRLVLDSAKVFSGGGSRPMFAALRGIVADSKGNLYVLDGLACVVFVFDNEGHCVRVIGRKGEGPGEFMMPRGMNVGPDDELYVVDQSRVHAFGHDGSLLSSMRHDGFLVGLDVLPQGGRFGILHGFGGDRLTETLALLDSSYSKATTIVSVPTSMWVFVDDGGGKSRSFIAESWYSPSLCVTRLLPDRLVYGYGTEYVLHVFSSEGKELLQIRGPTQRIPITRKEREADLRSILDSEEAGAWPADMLERSLIFPEQRPCFDRVITDDSGRIYVRRQGSILDAADTPDQIDIFSSTGAYLYQATSTVFPEIIRDGYCYRRTRDDATGEPAVTRWRIANWGDLKSE